MPGEKSHQHKLDRIRKPRVHITYDVETNGSPIKKELPFVLGVLADLAGHPDPDKPQEPLKKRQFDMIDRDNFNAVLASIGPRLALRVENTLQNDGSKLGLELKFKSIEDFEPENVVKQVEPLRKLLEIRQKLSDLKTKAGCNARLDSLLQTIIQDAEALKKQTAEVPGSPTTNGEG